MRQLTNAVRARARTLPRKRAAPPFGAPAAALTLAPARAQWVAKYRRNGSYTGRASYGCVGAAARRGDKGLPRAPQWHISCVARRAGETRP